METATSNGKKSIRYRDSVIQRHLLKFAQQTVSQSGKPLQGVGIPSKPRDVQHSITQTAVPSGLRVKLSQAKLRGTTLQSKHFQQQNPNYLGLLVGNTKKPRQVQVILGA
jgi:hypothetical protein